jgi:O-antigen/teichoic acid export membrane protein
MNLATYGFTLISARWLGPADYSAFAAMLGLVMVVNVVSLGLQATGARRVAERPGDRHVIEARIIATSLRAGVALALVCLAASPVVAAVLDLDSPVTAALLAVPAFCFAVMGGQAGILQGEGRWVPLSLVFAALGLARIAFGTAAISVWPTSLAAMGGGVALASAVPVLVGVVALRHTVRRPRPGDPPPASGRTHSRVLREVLFSSNALFAFFALATVDIVVARVVLDEHEAGLYAAGLIIVKAVQFLPQFVIVVAFPAMARHGAHRASASSSCSARSSRSGRPSCRTGCSPSSAASSTPRCSHACGCSRRWGPSSRPCSSWSTALSPASTSAPSSRSGRPSASSRPAPPSSGPVASCSPSSSWSTRRCWPSSRP